MKSVINGFKNLIKGMAITSKHLGRHAVTIQYPEQRDNIPERSRGIVVLLSDKETGELNCTACMLCMRSCPTAAIRIEAPRGEDKKRHLQSFTVDHTVCCFCGLCEQACNFTAIKMANMYEFSTWDKNVLIWDMNKLQEMGRDVPYEPKKKPAAKEKSKVEKKEKAADDDKEEKPDTSETEADDKTESKDENQTPDQADGNAKKGEA